jgi:hypothetical protein
LLRYIRAKDFKSADGVFLILIQEKDVIFDIATENGSQSLTRHENQGKKITVPLLGCYLAD